MTHSQYSSAALFTIEVAFVKLVQVTFSKDVTSSKDVVFSLGKMSDSLQCVLSAVNRNMEKSSLTMILLYYLVCVIAYTYRLYS